MPVKLPASARSFWKASEPSWWKKACSASDAKLLLCQRDRVCGTAQPRTCNSPWGHGKTAADRDDEAAPGFDPAGNLAARGESPLHLVQHVRRASGRTRSEVSFRAAVQACNIHSCTWKSAGSTQYHCVCTPSLRIQQIKRRIILWSRHIICSIACNTWLWTLGGGSSLKPKKECAHSLMLRAQVPHTKEIWTQLVSGSNDTLACCALSLLQQATGVRIKVHTTRKLCEL